MLRRTPRSASPPHAAWPNCTTTAKKTSGRPKRWAASRRPMPSGPTSGPCSNQESGDAVTLGTLRARMDYFEACHWKAQGDRARQRECLDKALATQSYDIEVLIECYQMPDSPADYRAKIRELIEKRLCELREQIADLGANPAAAQPCNEFAWLAANTEGDLDEALRLSKRSLESGRRARRLPRHARPSLFRQGRLCQRREASDAGPPSCCPTTVPCRSNSCCSARRR